MGAIWRFLRVERNRTILSWLGGGAAVVAAGLWAVVTWMVPADHPGPSTNCAVQGVAAGRDIRGSTITVANGGAPSTAGCGAPAKP